MFMILSQQPPIALMHGFGASSETMDKMKQWLVEENFTVVNCEVGNGVADSTGLPIKKQAELFYECIQQNSVLHNGFIGVGHSQGGIILRYYLQMMNYIKMLRLVTLASPLAGYYCTEKSNCTQDFIPVVTVYSEETQNTLSPSNFWKDPEAFSLYAMNSSALAFINNERDFDMKRKQNFMSIDKFIMFGSAYDEKIFPWQSSFFGFYKNNGFTVIPMEQTDIYTKDLFGLKSMDDQGRVVQLHTNFLHDDYKNNETFVKNELAPVLRFENVLKNTLSTSGKIGIAAAVIIVIILSIGIVLGYFIYKNSKKTQLNSDTGVELAK